MKDTITSSFYVTGGTLPSDASSYVERQADKDLLSGLLAGEYCYVLNTRQMGKSSLMIRTATRLREAGVHVAVLDLTAIGQNLSVAQWYDGLVTSLGEQLSALGVEDALEDFWIAASQEKLGPLQRFMAALNKVVLPQLTSEDSRLVVFIDEIDFVRSLPFSTDEFFAAIRACYNLRTQDRTYERIVFCLLGAATPADLIQDTRTSPFNVGRRIDLQDFSPKEAAPLAAELGPRGAQLLERVLYWTGGQPYLTQRLCRAIADSALTSDSVVTQQQVDQLCDGLFLSRSARDTDDNLSFVRSRILRTEAELAAVLDLYNGVRKGKRVADDEASALVSTLKLSGVVKVKNGILVLRNRIYDHVFDAEWVQASVPSGEASYGPPPSRGPLFSPWGRWRSLRCRAAGRRTTASRRRGQPG
jgi:hypothetical protein